MRFLTYTSILLIPFVLAGAAFAADAGSSARVRISQTHPLQLRGQGFAPNERVVLQVELGTKTFHRTLRTSAEGKFASTFSNLVLDRCSNRLAVKAKGTKGDRVEFELQTLPCPNDMTR